MGATLPAIARWIKSNPDGVSWLGFFYGGNITGAVFGCLLAGFYLLRFHDSATAVYVAVAINFAAALVSLAVSSHRPTFGPKAKGAAGVAVAPVNAAWSIYITIGISGATALAAEVVWTRSSVAAAGGHGLHLLDHFGSLSDWPGCGEQHRLRVLGRSSRRPRILCWAGASSCWRRPSPGLLSSSPARSPSGPSMSIWSPIPGIISSSI